MSINTLLHKNASLPAANIAQNVNKALSCNSTIVITAPPGAGKSTLLPLTMLKGLPQAKKIVMLEPRRLAARHIAQRMANMLGEEVGHTVGYRVRFDKKVSKQTQLEVVTEGVLSRMLIDDATLDGINVVIFDEFHERNINADLAFALTRQVQQLIRNDLKIVVMSATIDANAICQALHAPLIESEGRMFDVKIIHSQEDANIKNIAFNTLSAIREAHQKYEGDMLVFLPGQADITKCYEALGNSLSPTKVYALYGNLPLDEQQKAIAPSADNERKVVLATPIAETSLTIEGVKIVIDSGFYRKLVFNPRTGLSHLETMLISFDMAQQRSGRAGRTSEGVCYRLWTKQQELQMEQQRAAEIVEADMAPTLLSVAAFGENDIYLLPWLTPPPSQHVNSAKRLLIMLGAIADEGKITQLGCKMNSLPCHPRIANMMLQATTPQMKALSCDIAAVLEEKDPLQNDEVSSDLSIRISTLRKSRKQGKLFRWHNIAKAAQAYRKMLQIDECNDDVHPNDVGLLLSYAFPERIAKAINNIGHYKMANGNIACVESNDVIAAYSWIVIASVYAANGTIGRVFLAAPLDINNLNDNRFNSCNKIAWNTKTEGFTARAEKRIGQLLVSSVPLQKVNNNAIIEAICQKAQKDGLSMLNWNDDVQQLQQRISQVALWHPELNLPNVDTEHLLSTCAEWLPLYLTDGNKIKSSLNELKKIDLKEAIWAILPYDLQYEVNRLAPTHIQVPTGSRIRIDYRQGAEAPILSVRLQECFGMKDTPCVNAGQQPVLMELLSPGFKPVQLTQDLHNFWQDTYFEVRKELRRRYPKHAWPDNPLEAEAIRGTKRKPLK